MTILNALKIGGQQRTCFHYTNVVRRDVPNNLARFLSSKVKKEAKNTKKYSNSVLLPQTDFPVYAPEKAARDAYIANICGFKDLYTWQRKNMKGPEFILHDGPPYANGPVHLGHAVNKILKDIANREHLLTGQKIHYIPGWDCHGLPIESKALGNKDKALTPVEIREKARKFSQEAIATQGTEFKKWGIMADWDNKYLTSNPDFVKNQLRCFQNLHDRSLVFRDLKPVYWSPGSKSALAESELVYNHSHSSLSVFIQAKIVDVPPALAKIVASIKPGASVSLVAWTSTVWSLPANQAVAYGEELEYCLVESSPGSNELILVCQDLLASLADKLRLEPYPLATFNGKVLSGGKYEALFDDEEASHHPRKHLPLIPSDHVTNTSGTGLVHIAPGHGQQDFLLALEHKLPVHQSIAEDMCYTSHTPSSVRGLNILEPSTSEKILSLLDAELMFSEHYIHSYPYDWRAHCPVVILASRQWFLSTDTLRQKAEEALSKVEIYSTSDQQLLTMLRKRPYWCISRQRVWGTPIPAVYNKHTGEAIVHKDITERMCSLIDEKGTDFWWSCDLKEIVPESVLQKFKCSTDQLELGKDILDIWVDSGLTWSYLFGNNGQSDLCIEGADQSTGWFQSSLLLSTALQARAPYRSLRIHGFVVDEKGHKMSKSVGNVINPQDLTHGTPKQPALGIDVVRCWVATHAVGSLEIPASPGTFKNASETVTKLRKTARFLLGNIGEEIYKPQETAHWRFLDRLMLHRAYCFHFQMNSYYRTHRLNTIMNAVVNFVTHEISAHYLHLIKDRLYCCDKEVEERKQAVHVLASTLEVLVRAIAPILPHLAEEICLHWPDRNRLFFSPGFCAPLSWRQPELESLWEQFQSLRATIFQKAQDSQQRTDQFGATLEVPRDLYTILKRMQPEDESWDSELCELLQVAAVNLLPVAEEEPVAVELWKSERSQCLRCRRFNALPKCELCLRCEKVIAQL